MATRNAADASFTQQENAAESKTAAENTARWNRLGNAAHRGIMEVSTDKKKKVLATEFNRLAGLKNIYLTEYQPKILEAQKYADYDVKIGNIKQTFMEAHDGYNPDFFEQDLLNLRSQHDSV
jgi:hypothetical protein